jgi:hypothetical protein
MRRLVSIFKLLIKGDFKFIFNGISKRLFSEVNSYGLKRDMNVEFQQPKALTAINVRLSKKEDEVFFNMDNYNIGLTEMNIQNCFVAIDSKGIPCFRTWFMGYTENNKIQGFFKNLFPLLNKNEALIESVFTVPLYRGKGIMAAAISKIIEKNCAEIGARSIIAFVNIDNIPSLKGFKRSGFLPYVLKKEKWFLFTKRVSFVEVTNDLVDVFEKL